MVSPALPKTNSCLSWRIHCPITAARLTIIAISSLASSKLVERSSLLREKVHAVRAVPSLGRSWSRVWAILSSRKIHRSVSGAVIVLYFSTQGSNSALPVPLRYFPAFIPIDSQLNPPPGLRMTAVFHSLCMVLEGKE